MHRIKRFLAAGAVLLGLGLGLQVPVVGTAAAASATPASAGVATLMQSYSPSTGLIGGGWWTSAVALSTVMTYRQATGDTSYDYAMSTAFADNKSGNFENDYLDDTGWWGLVWMQAYDITGNTDYLHMAETDAAYMHSYWDSTCGGGVWWSTAKNYKNAIPNELFLELTAGLHNRVAGDTTYLGWANTEWSWFSGSGMINSSHLVNDGLTSGCANNGQQTWTYNQGVILAGLAELSKATGNSSLLTTAESIADAAVARLTTGGVLTEPCEPNCTGDAIAFKGIFVRGLKTLATTAGTSAYNGFFAAQSASIVAHDTNSAGQLGENWSGPIKLLTAVSQASADDALVAALNPATPPPPPASGPIVSGVSGSLCVDVSGASSVNGTKVQIWTCNNTGAQVWSVGSDGTLRALGKCLDITGAGTANGTLVELWDCNGGANQVWQSQSNGTLLNPVSGRCLDDPGFSTTTGTQLDIWDCNGGGNQVWHTNGTVSPPPPPPPASGPIVSGVSGSLCVDVSGASDVNGTKVQIWTCNNTGAQVWSVGSDGTLRALGKCLDITGAGTANGAPVELWDCNGGANQVWQPQSNGSLLNPASGRCLDDPGFSTTTGTQLDIWDCNNGSNQHWALPT